jgi:polyribonucleotide nucleotidyltransferase
MRVALEQAKTGRMHILGIMEGALPQSRTDISKFAPRLYTLQIAKEKIRDVIGPGGKTIRSIIEETGCNIEIEDDGRVVIASPDEPAARRAIQMVERLTQVPEMGKIYNGTVRRVENYGAFVEIMPGTDGLLHISELAPYRVREVSDLLKEGDEVEVKVVNIDEQGKIRLSRKAVIMESPDYDPSQYEGMEMAMAGGGGERERGGEGGGDRGGRGGDRGGRGGGGGGFRGGRGGGGGGGRGGDRGGRGGGGNR